MINKGMSQDCLRKAIQKDGEVTVAVVDATRLVQETMERLESWPPATVHLGQAMMGAILLLAATDKQDTEKIALQWNVKGPFGPLYAESSQLGHVRGTIAQPQSSAKDLETNLGAGTLQVRRITHTTFTGLVPSSGDVSVDLVEYLDQSEQRSAGINFTVKIGWRDTKGGGLPFVVEGAYGYLIDVLPQANEAEKREVLRRWDGVMRALGKISEWSIGDDPTSDMLRLILGEANPKEVLFQRIKFHCPCSKERAERALVLATKTEGQSAQKDEELVRCEFCGKVYSILKKGN